QALELLRRFHRAGIPENQIALELEQLEAAFADFTSGAEEWIDLGLAWLAIGRRTEATAVLKRAAESMVGVGFRKDYQLGEWMELVRPLVEEPAGADLTQWLVKKITRLNDHMESGAPEDAAMRLLERRATNDPVQAVSLAVELRDARIFDVQDIVACLLRASAKSADATWWTLLAELYVPLGASPLGDQRLATAAKATTVDLAPALAEVIARSNVEGRPSERVAWARATASVAKGNGLRADQIVPAETLAPSPERPVVNNASGSDEKPHTIPGLLADLLGEETSYGTARHLIKRLDELNADQR